MDGKSVSINLQGMNEEIAKLLFGSANVAINTGRIYADDIKFSPIIYAHDKSATYPTISKVIENGPATVAFFRRYASGRDARVIAKCHEGDKYDSMRGLLTCALRKTMRNHTMGDRMERVVKCLAKRLKTPKEMRAVAKALLSVADWAERDGVQ